jgi:hypothetical protein
MGSLVAAAGSLHSPPISSGWKIVVAIVIALTAAALATGLCFAMRAWRSSNLFDRQYRFPAVPEVALRLGASKSGGCMATLVFDAPARRSGAKSQTPGEKPLQ